MIYVLEDDDSIRELVVYTLCSADLPAVGFARPSDFWAQLNRNTPHLILLDIMLPEEDGLQILRRLRTSPATRRTMVMLLTAKGTEFDKVVGLDGGADDYLSKPFGMMELVARVRALMRRAEAEAEPEPAYTMGGLTLDPAKHTVTANGESVSLTLKEFELLRLLMRSRDTVLTRDRLLNEIWGYAFDGESRTVDVHIRSLRQKLGQAGSCIETVRGVGYRFRENEA